MANELSLVSLNSETISLARRLLGTVERLVGMSTPHYPTWYTTTKRIRGPYLLKKENKHLSTCPRFPNRLFFLLGKSSS